MRRGREEIIGWGDYRRIHGDHGMQDALSYGVYQPLTHAHGLSGLLDPLLVTEESTGLVAVKSEAIGPSVTVLQSMSFTPQTANDPITGVATFLPTTGTLSGDWVEKYVAQGYGVLVNLASVASSQPALTMTKHPDVVADACTPSAGWAWLTGPDALMIAAHNVVVLRQSQTQQTPAQACVAQGGMWDGEANRCVSLPAQAAAAPAPKSSSWILPVALIGGVVLVAGVLIIAQKGE
jgi:hypothetical protein